MMRTPFLIFVTAILASGCARLEFYDRPTPGALTYNEPMPYIFVSTTKDCVTTATPVSLPGPRRAVGLQSGYGSAELSVGLSNGIITSVGQKTDTKVPETITAVTGLAKLAMPANVTGGGKVIGCQPTAKLYPIFAGVPARKPIDFGSPKLVDLGVSQ
jgi:hypothetical protein